MMHFVLDNSVTTRWLLMSEKAADQRYSEKILNSLADNQAFVPNLWHLEVVNLLINAEKRKEIVSGDIERFISQLDMLPIHVDSLTANQAFNRTLGLAIAYKLSSYDAAYLELAVREGLALATLDKHLASAANKVGVAIFLR